MMDTIRARFAPSPTGPLHLGNARTAILNWLFARRHEGAFVLRLEDTDSERNVEGGEEMIFEALDWLGLQPDEGPREGGEFAPYRQSEREARYAVRAAALLESGRAFRCYCTAEELESRRVAAIRAGESPGRDPRCRELTAEQADRLAAQGRSAAIRLRVDSGPIEFEDRLKGALSIDGDDLGDMVLVRGDGRATYNFAVAVDDMEMRITHVIRGVGHLSNTPKQVLLYRAFGTEPPEFVHIPTVLAPGGGVLSKRTGATPLLEYRDRGYHPDAVLNYLSLLSWSAKDGREVLMRDELIRGIDLDRLGATDSEVDEDKMAWLSGQHLRREPPTDLAARWATYADLSDLAIGEEALVRAAEVFAKRTRLLSDARTELQAVFREPDLEAEEARARLRGAEAAVALELARGVWDEAPWDPAGLKRALRDAASRADMPAPAFYTPIRLALTGSEHGPELGEVAYALGREATFSRLDRALRAAEVTEETT